MACSEVVVSRHRSGRSSLFTGRVENPRDKAGGYAVQGLGGLFVKEPARQLLGRRRIAGVRNGAAADARRDRRDARWEALVAKDVLIERTPRRRKCWSTSRRGRCGRRFIENGILQEVYVERATRRGLISNIYKGRVSRVLPGMQAAFVDIGLERTAFSTRLRHRATRSGQLARPTGKPCRTFANSIREGEDVVVQVLKDPLGTKGARLTTFITLPSRFLVLLPTGSGVGVSSRIDDESERERLRGIVEELKGEDDGSRRDHRAHRGRRHLARCTTRRSEVSAQAVVGHSASVQRRCGKKPDT